MPLQIPFKECFTEFMGVFTLVFFGGWSVVLIANGKIDLISVSMVHSIALGIFIWCGGAYSGCHFNPAVSTALLVTKRLDSVKYTHYVASQFIGSLTAAIFLYITVPEPLYSISFSNGAGLGSPHFNYSYSFVSGIIMEAIGTFILMFVVCCLVDQNKAPQYSMVIGFVVGLCILAIGEVTGSSVNPFRYIGPALLSGCLWDCFIYLFAPLVGSVGAVMLYDHLFALSDEEKEDIKKKNEYANNFRLD